MKDYTPHRFNRVGEVVRDERQPGAAKRHSRAYYRVKDARAARRFAAGVRRQPVI